jgi:hypothetical protein
VAHLQATYYSNAAGADSENLIHAKAAIHEACALILECVGPAWDAAAFKKE